MKADKKKHWEILNSEIVFNNIWYKVRKDTVQLPSGTIIKDYYVSELKDVVSVFALTKEQKVIFVKQYRHGVKKVLLELPAGTYKKGETPKEVAEHELREETGYKTDKLISLGTIFDYPTKNSHRINLFLAKGAVYQGKPRPEKTEDIEVVLLPMKDLLRLIKKGEISVSGTIVCILRALIYLKAAPFNTYPPNHKRSRF